MSIATSSAVQPLAPLRIEIKGAGQKYRTIGDLVWDNVPAFAVLTGVNGSGKTQLLELLAYKLTGTQMPNHEATRNISVTTASESFGPDSVAFVPSSWDIQGTASIGVQALTQLKAQLYQQLTNRQTLAINRQQRAKRSRVDKLIGKSLTTISQQDFIKIFPDDYAFMLEEEDVVTGLAHVMLAHKLRLADTCFLEGKSPAQAAEKMGTAPWDIVNEALSEADFAYRLVPPTEAKMEDTYEIKFRDTVSKVELAPGELSSGEKAILRTLLWLFNSRHNNQFPKLLLLDEPDAHLHPSMTRQFLTVVKDVLVDRYGVRVIIATHSPSTVALAPEGSVFEMYKEDPRIQPASSTAHAVGLLTAGLVVVSPGTRFVFVEDTDDQEFYRAVADVLIDIRKIASVPSLVFLPASIGSGSAKVPGGNSKVLQWVEKFDQPPLLEMFKGVIDLDRGNTPTNARVKALGRYSFENYLLDPINMFGLLVDLNQPLTVNGVTISQGHEHSIGNLGPIQLQAIVDVVAATVEPNLGTVTAAERQPKAVVFSNGIKINYPAWMLDRQGHGLLAVYQKTLGGPQKITPPALIKMLRRIRLIPVELVTTLTELQQ